MNPRFFNNLPKPTASDIVKTILCLTKDILSLIHYVKPLPWLAKAMSFLQKVIDYLTPDKAEEIPNP